MNDTTTKTEMRELLARWAELEPGRCKHTTTKSLVTHDKDLEEIHLIDSAGRWRMVLSDGLLLDLEEDDFMRIQYSVQQAIVARDWSFELSYYSILGSYGAEIDIDSHRSVNRPGSSPTEALLTAYLRALEYGPLEATK